MAGGIEKTDRRGFILKEARLIVNNDVPEANDIIDVLRGTRHVPRNRLVDLPPFSRYLATEAAKTSVFLL